jgi:hypothetical protein
VLEGAIGDSARQSKEILNGKIMDKGAIILWAVSPHWYIKYREGDLGIRVSCLGVFNTSKDERITPRSFDMPLPSASRGDIAMSHAPIFRYHLPLEIYRERGTMEDE